MVGATGSGKSHWIQENRLWGMPRSIDRENLVVIAIDDYYVNEDGEYEYDKLKTAPAMRDMMSEFIEHMQGIERDYDIVIDSKNLTDAEIAPWILVAQAHKFIVRVVVMDTPPRVSAERNDRGLSESVITNQHSRMLRMLENWPRWWPKPKIIKGDAV